MSGLRRPISPAKLTQCIDYYQLWIVRLPVKVPRTSGIDVLHGHELMGKQNLAILDYYSGGSGTVSI